MGFETELCIPAPKAISVSVRYGPYPIEGTFAPESWPNEPLVAKGDGWWKRDISSMQLADGIYQYEFSIAVMSPDGIKVVPVSDPFANELVKFSGYRSVMRIKNGQRVGAPFSWADEMRPGKWLRQNHELVIYELPMRWVDAPTDCETLQVGLGTFDKATFEHLDYIEELGCNAIELLPVLDSQDTLNWGYGTRFFYAPDADMGGPFELKYFIKSCHQRGIRVILDVVMNHARACPLADLAKDWYFGTESGRNAWGGDLFLFNNWVRPGYNPTRQWHFDVAEFWIREYRIDGFRIDEYRGIDNWDFVREFRRRAEAAASGRPFIVIAEDSARRPEITQDIAAGGRVVDAMWDFDTRDEVRRLLSNNIGTKYGKPSRSARVRAMIIGDGLINGDDWRTMWNAQQGKEERARFTDMAQRVAYGTSHDTEQFCEQRLYPYFMEQAKDEVGSSWGDPAIAEAHPTVMEQVFSVFAITLTLPGIPMFLAGEEFADLHDRPHGDWRQKMADPCNWARATIPTHKALLERVRQLIQRRVWEPCLQRNEVVFFGLRGGPGGEGFHPTFDDNDGERVFMYCRTAGKPLTQAGQIAVICNAGRRRYSRFLVDWPWGTQLSVEEVGAAPESPALQYVSGQANIPLQPFQTRVFLLR